VPSDRPLAIAYGLPLLVCLWVRRRWVLWSMAGALLLAALGKTFFHLDTTEPLLQFGMRAASILTLAGVIHAVIALRERLEVRSAELERSNAELARSNEELRVREEEIAQQNEELQSQTEELEQQSEELLTQTEELQRANEELTRRERVLQNLVEVARSFSGEGLPLSEVCRLALPLVGQPAAAVAILERGPEGQVVIRGHYGFGRAGPQRAGWNFEDSFAALIMERNETGYLEDAAQRSDLSLTQRAEGEPFCSILATPLRLHGKPIGVVEVLAAEPCQWTIEQFRLVEWVAAECSLLIETLRLQDELEARRREAEEASLRKTRFLAAVSHDIRTPVNAITLMAELLTRAVADPHRTEDLAELAADLKANARGLVELVSDVLDIARFDSGRLELEISEFPLLPLLQGEMRRLSPVAEAKGLRLHIEPLQSDVRLRTDRVKLTRVLNNLIGNAIKFTEEGEVRISPEPVNGGLHIHVSDTGVGIPAEHLPRIFDEFFQLKNPARDRSKGTGLGLAICRRLVEALGAELAVDSMLGAGSTFTLTLPDSLIAGNADPPRPETALASAGRGSALAGTRVLLVEDHDTTRRATARLLAAEGAIVTQAPTASAALEALDQDSPEVLLLDMMLPDMDGREVLQALSAQRPAGLRCVFVITGDARESRRVEALGLGADGLFTKPLNLELLVQELQRLKDLSRVGK
jgi:signal transduction histidine kinase/ActR/RegA family two-component response regulator